MVGGSNAVQRGNENGWRGGRGRKSGVGMDGEEEGGRLEWNERRVNMKMEK